MPFSFQATRRSVGSPTTIPLASRTSGRLARNSAPVISSSSSVVTSRENGTSSSFRARAAASIAAVPPFMSAAPSP